MTPVRPRECPLFISDKTKHRHLLFCLNLFQHRDQHCQPTSHPYMEFQPYMSIPNVSSLISGDGCPNLRGLLCPAEYTPHATPCGRLHRHTLHFSGVCLLVAFLFAWTTHSILFLSFSFSHLFPSMSLRTYPHSLLPGLLPVILWVQCLPLRALLLIHGRPMLPFLFLPLDGWFHACPDALSCCESVLVTEQVRNEYLLIWNELCLFQTLFPDP